jgi:hypothetical protein
MSQKTPKPVEAGKDTAVRIARVQGLRGSGASGSHGDRRTKRLRTRKAKERQALKDYE